MGAECGVVSFIFLSSCTAPGCRSPPSLCLLGWPVSYVCVTPDVFFFHVLSVYLHGMNRREEAARGGGYAVRSLTHVREQGRLPPLGDQARGEVGQRATRGRDKRRPGEAPPPGKLRYNKLPGICAMSRRVA